MTLKSRGVVDQNGRRVHEVGDLAAADRSAASAVAKVEASMAAHPDQRKVHVDALRTIYSFSAQVKRLRGDSEAATTLEPKAAALGSSK